MVESRCVTRARHAADEPLRRNGRPAAPQRPESDWRQFTECYGRRPLRRSNFLGRSWWRDQSAGSREFIWCAQNRCKRSLRLLVWVCWDAAERNLPPRLAVAAIRVSVATPSVALE